jgi:hypothetical protein
MGWRIILPALRAAGWKLLLVAGSIAAGAALIEAGVRLADPQELPSPGPWREDPVVGLRAEPGFAGPIVLGGRAVHVRTNSLGHRGPERDWERPPALRVVGLGDSFTFGSGVAVEETFLARIETALGAGAEVVNAGLPGYGPDNAALLLEADGPRIRPHVVLLSVFVGNDFSDMLTGPHRIAVRGGLMRSREGVLDGLYRPLVPGRLLPADLPLPSAATGARPVRDWLRARSHAFRLVARRYRDLRARWEGDGAGRPAYTLFEGEAFCLRQWAPEMHEAWARLRASLLRARDWCDSNGARFAIALVPTRPQVDPRHWAAERARFALREEDFDLDKPQALLRGFAAANGIPAVDLLPALRARSAEGGVYFEDDIHWNARGHAVAAEEILRALRAEGLALRRNEPGSAPVPAARQ